MVIALKKSRLALTNAGMNAAVLEGPPNTIGCAPPSGNYGQNGSAPRRLELKTTAAKGSPLKIQKRWLVARYVYRYWKVHQYACGATRLRS